MGSLKRGGHFRGWSLKRVVILDGVHFRGVHFIGVFTLEGCSL